MKYWGGDIVSLIIGVDYGINDDIPMYTVGLKADGKLHVIDAGKIDEFDYSKYVASKYQMTIVGESKDVERFKATLKI